MNKKHMIYSYQWAIDEHEGDNWADFYDFHWDDEVGNLNREVDSDIIAIVDMGLWDGRHNGYKILGNKLNDIMYCGNGDKEIWYDGKNVCGSISHHDGCHYVTFRKIKRGVNRNNLISKVLNGEDVSRLTVSLKKDVCEIYGW